MSTPCIIWDFSAIRQQFSWNMSFAAVTWLCVKLMQICWLGTTRGMSHGTRWYGGQAPTLYLVMYAETGNLLLSKTLIARHWYIVVCLLTGIASCELNVSECSIACRIQYVMTSTMLISTLFRVRVLCLYPSMDFSKTEIPKLFSNKL